MIVLDTNVVSELMKPRPNRTVEMWLVAQSPTSLFISSVSEAELRYGVAILAPGRKRERLAELIDAVIVEAFPNRVLAFDSAASINYGEIASTRRRAGKPISQFDAQIAAIAKSHDATLASRNVADFEGCGIELLDPWSP